MAFKIDPGSVEVLRDLGVLALETNDLDRAQKTFRALLLQRLDAQSGISKGEVFYYLGEICMKQGDKAKAVQMLERAVENEPTLARAKAMLVRAEGVIRAMRGGPRMAPSGSSRASGSRRCACAWRCTRRSTPSATGRGSAFLPRHAVAAPRMEAASADGRDGEPLRGRRDAEPRAVDPRLQVVRGSSSRGGARGLAALVRRLKTGRFDAAFAVDGPRGPYGVPKPGAALAARAAGAVVVPMGSAGRGGMR